MHKEISFPHKQVPMSSHVVSVLTRALADLMISCAALSLALGLALFEANRHADVVSAMNSVFNWQNWSLLLAPLLFPVSFGLFGVYSPGVKLGERSKITMIGIVCIMTSIIAIGLSQLNGAASPLRAVLLVFSLVASAGTIAARLVKRGILVHEPLDQTRVNRTVLVVGGAGYIGAVVVRKLLKKGYRVRVLESLVYGDAALREILGHRRLEFLRGDCRNIHDVVNAMAGVGSVIHLAAIVGDPACDQDHKTALETNYAATRMMIEVAKGERVRRFVFASSCSVYGASDDVMYEDSIVRPISLYADTKVDSEKALLAAASDAFHPTVLRFSTIFGLAPRPRFDLVVNLLAARAIQERTITIFNGEQWRPFLHVSDAAEAVVRTLEAPSNHVSGQIFNVGDDRMNYSLADVGKLIQNMFPGTAVENVENADRRSYRVSFDKIKRVLRFRCTRSIEDGLAEIKAAFERRQITDYRDPYYSNVQFLKKHGSPLHRDRKDEHVMAAFAGRSGD
jgi:nucleoside-diphosphate-sugar epimerase